MQEICSENVRCSTSAMSTDAKIIIISYYDGEQEVLLPV